MRKTLVDTFASVFFFTIMAACIELFVAGMDPSEVLTARLIMIPVMVLTGRPYGIWRDWFFKVGNAKSTWAKTVLDSIAFLSFQLPIYAVTLVVSGADQTEIMTALSSAAVLMLVISRPFGLFLELLRRWAGVKSE